MENGSIKTFHDLRVYQESYALMIVILKDILSRLPAEERFDLKDQIRRCCKAVPSLIAEGFAKRYQKRHWQKYLVDATGEANEMIHHLSVCRDVYDRYMDQIVIGDLINRYEVVCKQLTNLGKVWRNYHEN